MSAPYDAEDAMLARHIGATWYPDDDDPDTIYDDLQRCPYCKAEDRTADPMWWRMHLIGHPDCARQDRERGPLMPGT